MQAPLAFFKQGGIGSFQELHPDPYEKDKKMTDFWADAEVISSYSRAQAIADGAMFDVSTTAKEAGFSVPVAVTSAAWAEAVTWDSENGGGQDETGRLWDVLWMARIAAIRSRGRHSEPSDRTPFSVYRVPNVPDAMEPNELELVAHIGGGDNGEAVVTIMLPNED